MSSFSCDSSGAAPLRIFHDAALDRLVFIQFIKVDIVHLLLLLLLLFMGCALLSSCLALESSSDANS